MAEAETTSRFSQPSSLHSGGKDSMHNDASSHFTSNMEDVHPHTTHATAPVIADGDKQTAKPDIDTQAAAYSSDERFTYLASGLDRIFSQSENFDLKAYMEFYSQVHNYCVSQKAPSKGKRNHRGAHLLGEEIYDFLCKYLRTHLRGVYSQMVAQPKQRLVSFYLDQWRRYIAAAKRNKHLFAFLDRHWVKREIDEGKRGIYDIWNLHLVVWKENVLEASNGSYTSVLELLRRRIEESETGREESDAEQIEEVRESFVIVGRPNGENDVKEIWESFSVLGLELDDQLAKTTNNGETSK